MSVNTVKQEVFVEKECGAMTKPLIDQACNPRHSVIVEACAGSGKTWLLISRIIRLFLDGVEPDEILAITFTRKAAQEMRNRLENILIRFSKISDEELLAELEMRGFSNEEAMAHRDLARGLFEKIFSSPKQISIDTFHGWFSRIHQYAPFNSGINSRAQLREDQQRLLSEALEDWWQSLGKGSHEFSKLKNDYIWLLGKLSANQIDELLMGKSGLIAHRSAWIRYRNALLENGSSPEEHLSQIFPRAHTDDPFSKVFIDPEYWTGLEELYQWYSQSEAPNDQKFSRGFQLLLDVPRDHSHISRLSETALGAFFTLDLTPIKALQKCSKSLEKILSKNGVPKLLETIPQKVEAWTLLLEEHLVWKSEQNLFQINLKWQHLGVSMLDHFERFKSKNSIQDFNDLELNVASLISKEETAGYLLSRLDSKYKHILIDEFQDTNPLQWQILREWFNAYSQDEERPVIFIVGDPKQSIYRFRRADARLFGVAIRYLDAHFNAQYLPLNQTRRVPSSIVDSINQTFEPVAEMDREYPFQAHISLVPVNAHEDPSQLTGAYTLPLIPKGDTISVLQERNPFVEAMQDRNYSESSQQAHQEAFQVGQTIKHLLKTQRIRSEENHDKFRPSKFSDCLVLVRSKTHLGAIEAGFRKAGVPCQLPKRGGLLKTLEAEDLYALLSFLVMPSNNLALAHVLRSPFFNCSEEELQWLANEYPLQRWWEKLPLSTSPIIHKAYQMLTSWMNLAGFLPVHDLLDHIYAEADVLKVYSESVPAELQAKVLANLEAFLHLALELNGGRYLSLNIFLEEIDYLRKGDELETPEEGPELVQELNEEFSSVQVMTIHGAKGLEAPFVFLMNANSSPVSTNSLGVLVSWDPNNSNPDFVCAHTKELRGGLLLDAMGQEMSISSRENWNLLYVAMTRAKNVFIVSGIADAITKDKPMGINEKSWYGHLCRQGMNTFPIGENASFQELENSDISKEGVKTVTYPQFPRPLTLQTGNSNSSLNPPKDANQLMILSLGTAVHYLLDKFTHQGKGPFDEPRVLPKFEMAIENLNLAPEIAKTAVAIANRILNAENLKLYFWGEHIQFAWNELHLIDTSSRTLKVDRLIELANELILLDYKLTIPDESDELFLQYQNQVKRYREVILGIRTDKPIRMYLIDQHCNVKEIL